MSNLKVSYIFQIDKATMNAKKMKDRVIQEVTIHFRLKHESILEMFTFFEDYDYIYLILELAHYGALHHYFVDKQKALDEPEACEIFKQVVSGLQYLHSRNIMHRDLSMSNLLLTTSERGGMQVKIADFGLATQLNHNSQNKHTTLCGTPNYISPEVASRSSHGLPTDIWGLGCLLYTLLVGHPPFDTNGIKSTLTQVVMGNYTIPDHISAEACDLIHRMLCKDPSKRIRLDDVVIHPFMMVKARTNFDSGINSIEKSSNLKTEFRPPSQVLNQVVGSASMLRNSLNLNQEATSYHQQSSIHQHQQPHYVNYPNQQDHISLHDVKTIDVPPFSTIRLQPTRHKTKNVILSILDEPPGEVALEFIKYKSKYGEERVFDVCRISSDGLRIALYQPNDGKGVRVGEQPPELPNNGTNDMFNYENLPEKHWKKYMYAYRFVQMVRAKTPKVTFYSEIGKSQLMENLEDFEMSLYKGGKITKNGASSKFSLQIDANAGVKEVNLIQHAEKCYQHCVNIEQTMSLMDVDLPCFPIIIGRRPIEQEPGKEQRKENTFNNYISCSQTPLGTPKLSMPSYSQEQTPSPSFKILPFGSNNYRVPDTPTSFQRMDKNPGNWKHFSTPTFNSAPVSNGLNHLRYNLR